MVGTNRTKLMIWLTRCYEAGVVAMIVPLWYPTKGHTMGTEDIWPGHSTHLPLTFYTHTESLKCTGACVIINLTRPSSRCISHISNINRTLVGNKIVDHSDVVRASLAGAASTTSSFPTNTWLKGTGQRQHQDETITISVLVFVLHYMADLTVYQINVETWGMGV